MIGTLRTKIDSTQKSILKGRRVIGDQQSLIRRFKAELHCCADDIQDPEKLKKGVEALYAKHAQYVEADSGEGVDKGVREEFARLEDNLKRMLSDLQENYRRDADERAAENMRQMTNNMALIREITRQRESNRRLRSQVDRMEMQLKERARDNKGPDPAVVARQHARAQELQRLVDHYASTLEAAGIHMPSDDVFPPLAPVST